MTDIYSHYLVYVGGNNGIYSSGRKYSIIREAEVSYLIVDDQGIVTTISKKHNPLWEGPYEYPKG